jgi:hypothetical protein
MRQAPQQISRHALLTVPKLQSLGVQDQFKIDLAG